VRQIVKLIPPLSLGEQSRVNPSSYLSQSVMKLFPTNSLCQSFQDRKEPTILTDCVRDQALLHHPTPGGESMPGLPGVLREGENIRIGVKFNTTLHILAFGMLSFTCAIVNLYGYYIIMLFFDK